MSEIIELRSNFVTDTDDLTNAAWAEDDSVYVTTDKMIATNKSADGITEIGTAGVIGTVLEVPDLDNLPDRMVIKLTTDDDLHDALKNLLQSHDL